MPVNLSCHDRRAINLEGIPLAWRKAESQLGSSVSVGVPARGQPIPTHTLNTDKPGRPALGNGVL